MPDLSTFRSQLSGDHVFNALGPRVAFGRAERSRDRVGLVAKSGAVAHLATAGDSESRAVVRGAFKDTSLAFIVNVPELTTVAEQVNNRSQIYPMEIFLFIGLLYFILCGGLSWAARIPARL